MYLQKVKSKKFLLTLEGLWWNSRIRIHIKISWIRNTVKNTSAWDPKQIVQDSRCLAAQFCHFLLLSCYLSSWLALNDLWFVPGGQPDLRVLVTRRSEVGSRRQQVSLWNKEKCMSEIYTKVLWKHWFFKQIITNFLLCVKKTRTKIKNCMCIDNVMYLFSFLIGYLYLPVYLPVKIWLRCIVP